MKNALLFVGGFVLGVVSFVKVIFGFGEKIRKFSGVNPFINGTKDCIVCFVSSLLYGRPDQLYVRRTHTREYAEFRRRREETWPKYHSYYGKEKNEECIL